VVFFSAQSFEEGSGVLLVDIGEIADHHYLCFLFNRVE
jgi:hypothetical protein